MARPIDPQIRAAALADIAAGGGIREVARKYGIGHQTVIAWSDQMGDMSPVVGPQKRNDVGALVLTFMEESLATLIEHVRLARDPDWFKEQRANELAIYDGVLVDKITRILSALQPAPMDDEAN